MNIESSAPVQEDLSWLHVLAADMDRARSLTVSLLVKYCEWEQLVNLRCLPSDYLPTSLDLVNPSTCRPGFIESYGLKRSLADEFRFDYQITELLRKNADLPIDSDPRAAAIEKFFAAEEQCLITNRKLFRLGRQVAGDWFQPETSFPREIVGLVKFWRKTVKSLLGDLPNELIPKFSSGSTFNDRKFLLPQDKMSTRPTVTSDAWSVIGESFRHTQWQYGLSTEFPHRSSPELVQGNRFTMVPKDALTHRGICVEPSLNVTHQLSVGKVIRKRLKARGIDLKHGQALHQRLAEAASLTLEQGTIDLKSASDTVSYQLVKLILPEEWFELLDSLRSPATKIEGKWIINEKFSSMGNGFTFELESLLFYTLAVAVDSCLRINSSVIKVYGDDIICDTALARELVPALLFFGFQTNERKTFIGDVPFRESCGGDFYSGLPVRGHYLEEIPREPHEWIALANGIRRMARADLDRNCGLDRYKRTWLRIISRIPKHLRSIRGPEELGDLCLHDSEWYTRRNKEGRREIRVLTPTFDECAYSPYDRKRWTRGAIISAVVLKCLYHQGDSQVYNRSEGNWKFSAGRQKLSRIEPTGHKVSWIEYAGHVGNTNVDRWLSSRYTLAGLKAVLRDLIPVIGHVEG